MMSPGESELPLLRIDALTKRFGGFVALDNVSVDIRPGERFGLIGPNGSGKTTLINCISGAFRTEVGTVVFGGEDITRLPPHIRTRRGRTRPATHFISVLLPLPLVPSNATVSPASTWSVTPRSAFTAP